MTEPLDSAVVLITGVMASGKSTVAQALAERLPRAAHVRGDVFRRMVVSGRVEYEPGAGAEAQAQLRLRYRQSTAVAEGYARAGFTAVVQDVVLGEELRTYVDGIGVRPLYVVVLAPRADVVETREAGRGKTGYGEWGVSGLDRVLRDETPRIGLWLDTSALTVEESVDAVLAGLMRARVG
ncbi:AAA family ATPase [Streptomyces sp. Q6]|uniref:AAA family ATPase n=1 Tax=Streptomyces citrinus TaxID=3118173 RepID=A0ACD5ABK7_9ACTN